MGVFLETKTNSRLLRSALNIEHSHEAAEERGAEVGAEEHEEGADSGRPGLADRTRRG